MINWLQFMNIVICMDCGKHSILKTRKLSPDNFRVFTFQTENFIVESYVYCVANATIGGA